ncbi:MAG: DUF192 domain-containing protein [Candidatus Omnitrophota bacterium]
MYTVINKTKNRTVVTKAKTADTFFQRLWGLMLRPGMESEEGLIFYNVSSIHMFFMRFAIDVIFLDKHMRVVKICPALKPWSMAASLKATITLELPSLKAAQAQVEIGDTLAFIPH